jgi:hypothetical protein
MNGMAVRKPLLPWLIGGLLLGLVQVAAVAVKDPLGVSTQFVVAEGMVMNKVAPEAAANHPLISQEKNRKAGYGWWLDVGLIVGAAVAAIALGRWRPTATTVWWQANHGPSLWPRFLFGFLGGFLILFGARLAGGCTSGMFASGWAQLSVSVLPFTVALFGGGMIAARIFYPRTPPIETGTPELMAKESSR